MIGTWLDRHCFMDPVVFRRNISLIERWVKTTTWLPLFTCLWYHSVGGKHATGQTCPDATLAHHLRTWLRKIAMLARLFTWCPWQFSYFYIYLATLLFGVRLNLSTPTLWRICKNDALTIIIIDWLIQSFVWLGEWIAESLWLNFTASSIVLKDNFDDYHKRIDYHTDWKWQQQQLTGRIISSILDSLLLFADKLLLFRVLPGRFCHRY